VELPVLIGRYDLSDSTSGPINVKNKGDYFQVGVSIPYGFSAQSKLCIGLYYTKGTNNYFRAGDGIRKSNLDAIGCWVFRLSFSRSFKSNLQPIDMKNRLYFLANDKRDGRLGVD